MIKEKKCEWDFRKETLENHKYKDGTLKFSVITSCGSRFNKLPSWNNIDDSKCPSCLKTFNIKD